MSQSVPIETQAIPSELLERYELLDELGRGGFGVVFKARQRATGQLVAIKQIRALDNTSSSVHEEMRRRFKREMSLIGNLRNAHVVRLLDAGADGDNLFMVLEFVDGVALSKLLHHDGALPRAVAERIIAQVLEALAEAHDLGIVHRDLKPDNIMISGSGLRCTAKVLDFGIAGVEQDFRGALEVGHETITKFGQFLGTPSYMAPEQFQLFDNPRVQTDIYAIGLILLECLTGERAVQGTNLMEIAQKQARERVAVPDTLAPELVAIIRRATEKDPELRFGSADEMLRVVHAVASGAKLAELTLSPPREVGTAQPSQPTVNLDAVLPETLASDPATPALDLSARDDAVADATRPATPRAHAAEALGAPEEAAPVSSKAATHAAPPDLTTQRGGGRGRFAIAGAVVVVALVAAGYFALSGSSTPANHASASPSTPTEPAAVTGAAAEPAPTAPVVAAAPEPSPLETAPEAALPETTAPVDDTESRIASALLEALTAQQQRRFDDARAAYGTVLELAPTHADALEGLAKLLLDVADFDGALAQLELLSAHEARAGSVAYLRARALRGLERLDEARDQLEGYLQHWSDGPFAREARAQLDEVKRELRRRSRKDRTSSDEADAGASGVKGGALHDF